MVVRVHYLICISVVAAGLQNKQRRKVYGHVIAAVVMPYMCMGMLKCVALSVKDELLISNHRSAPQANKICILTWVGRRQWLGVGIV